ncbi:hypothetical protein ETAA8_30470 [Anatilimnocola aggregata]|uniref:Uncharacterized protein n=1 Tax=Anatilimnocola aggregata TaxID=2528021 RepID=A0A517YCI5_9BACT|nr:hypothetical protein ETAA8_30470 [Anatilimnocola aggregata]
MVGRKAAPLGNVPDVKEGEDDGADDGRDDARPALALEIENEDDAGDGNKDHQQGCDIDDPRPNEAGIAPFVQVVNHRDHTHHGFGQLILAGRAIDVGIGCVAGAFEDDRAFALVNAELADGATNFVIVAEMLDHLELGDLQAVVDLLAVSRLGEAGGQGTVEPLDIDLTGMLRDALAVDAKPGGMVERDTSDGEEKERREAEQRNVDVQPANRSGKLRVPSFGLGCAGRLRLAAAFTGRQRARRAFDTRRWRT